MQESFPCDNESIHQQKKMKTNHLPLAESVVAFLDNPELFAPQFEFLTLNYIDDETVLTHAIKNLNSVAVKALLDAGADPNFTNKKGVTPMSGAAHKGSTSIMQFLLDAGANVNQVNQSGSTALIQASHFGWDEAVRFLLANNATPDFANSKGTTALMRAAQEGHLLISDLLIQKGSDVNKKNKEGMNALMLASQRGHANMVMLLIQSRAHMDEQTSQGSTALMLACKRGHEQVVEALVSMGAEIFMRDARGRTALDTAIKRQHHSLLSWLDTQVQKRKVSENCLRLRTRLLMDMRRAHAKGKLRLSQENLTAFRVINAVKKGEGDELVKSITDFDTSFAVHQVTSLMCNAPPVLPALMARRKPKYAEWQWPLLLSKCMNMPDGVFESIIEFLPVPRIWHWSLLRLKRRCRFAPKQAITDVSVMLDEMLTDMCVFGTKLQSLHLVRLSHNRDVQQALVSTLKMPLPLLDALCQYADVQSLNHRTTDSEMVFKPLMAINMMNLAVELFRFYREHSTTSTALCLSKVSKSRDSTLSSTFTTMVRRNENEIPDNTTNNAALDDEEDMSDAEAMMDQDSETDLAGEDEGDMDMLDDDDEDDNANAHGQVPQTGYIIGL